MIWFIAEKGQTHFAGLTTPAIQPGLYLGYGYTFWADWL
jgi:hypothetical protein